MTDRTEKKTAPADAEGSSGHASLPDWPLFLSPWRFIFLVVALVLITVAGRNLIVLFFPPLSPWMKILLETGLILLLLSPAYFYLHLPLRTHYAGHLKEHGEIRSLSRQTLRIMEGERRTLAKELHDNFGQTLTALQFQVDILRYSLPPEKGDLAQQCDQMQESISRLGDEMRGLCAHLHPSILETCGIVPALEWHLQRLRDHGSGVDLILEAEGCGDNRLSPEVSITLYRLCEEALNNIVRHACAERATVRLECDRDSIVLTIVDDGSGFDPAEASGIGILSMRERAAALGGALHINSAKGHGTVVRAEIPV
jgi:signal transduction histidine kinase